MCWILSVGLHGEEGEDDMTERERLIELIRNTPKIPFTVCGRAQGKTYQTAKNIADYLLANGVMCIDTNTVDVVKNREPLITAFGMPLNELADLIRAKREGRVIVPPCKVGDTVYVCFSRTRVIECKVAQIIIEHIEEIGMSFICYGGMRFDMRHWGKTVFLTREEAEKALEGMQ